jgi:hypothetical protein
MCMRLLVKQLHVHVLQISQQHLCYVSVSCTWLAVMVTLCLVMMLHVPLPCKALLVYYTKSKSALP